MVITTVLVPVALALALQYSSRSRIGGAGDCGGDSDHGSGKITTGSPQGGHCSGEHAPRMRLFLLTDKS